MMAKYLLDLDVRPKVPGVSEPHGEFADVVEPIAIALAQEKKVTDQISELTSIAREERDFVSEQFMQWFLKEQVEEIDLMSTLLHTAERCRDRPLDIEDFIAREGIGGDEEADPSAPAAAVADLELFTLAPGGQTADEMAKRVAGFLAEARRSLDLALYDVRLPGRRGDTVADAIRDAAGRGVEVRIAYNADDPRSRAPAAAQHRAAS